MSGINDIARSIMQDLNQDLGSHKKTQITKNIFPAIVINSEDPLDQSRVVARIISIDSDGKARGGRDRDISDSQIPFAVPLNNSFFRVIPKKGEMVFIILENPESPTSARYWSGPIMSNMFRLNYQHFEDSHKIFDYTQFTTDQIASKRPSSSPFMPNLYDIAIMGRDDSQITLKPRELVISSGIFKKGTFEINQDPSFLQLKQIELTGDTIIKEMSQANLSSVNINIFSPYGKFRDEDTAAFELNENLKNFGDTAKKLHPAVFGDELIKLMDIVIQFLLNHIHTPQNSPVKDQLTKKLEEYTVQGKLQSLISNHVRVN